MSNRPHSEGSLPCSVRKIATGTDGTPNLAEYAQVATAAVRDRFIEVRPFALVCVDTRDPASVTQAEDGRDADSHAGGSGSGGERRVRGDMWRPRGHGCDSFAKPSRSKARPKAIVAAA
jgi:hypothetical protein